MKSMTGYGRGDCARDGFKVTVELSSVNRKQTEISVNLPREMAMAMILGTMEGSAAWALNSKVPLGDLWRQVVTPGGTTEAGIQYFNEKGFLEIFVEGLNRSTTKARSLGDPL